MHSSPHELFFHCSNEVNFFFLKIFLFQCFSLISYDFLQKKERGKLLLTFRCYNDFQTVPLKGRGLSNWNDEADDWNAFAHSNPGLHNSDLMPYPSCQRKQEVSKNVPHLGWKKQGGVKKKNHCTLIQFFICNHDLQWRNLCISQKET